MKGEYFSWLSHDDLYHEKRIAEDIKLIKKTKAKITYSKVIVIDFKGDVKKELFADIQKVESPYDVIKLSGINMCSMTIKKLCFESVGFFNEKNKTIQDVEMSLILSKYYNFYYNDNAITFCRDHPSRGSYSLNKAHYNDSKYMCEFIKNNFTLNDFFSIDYDLLDKRQIANYYIKLSDVYIIFHGFKHADNCYKLAFVYDRRIFSKLFLSHLFGSKILFFLPFKKMFKMMMYVFSFVGKYFQRLQVQLLINSPFNRFTKKRIKGKNNIVNYSGAFLKKNQLIINGNFNKINIGAGCKIIGTKINVIGNNHTLIINPNCIIDNGSFCFEDNNCKIIIGNNTIIHNNFHIAALDKGSISIGNNCLFSSFIDIRTSDSHSIIDLNRNIRLNPGQNIIIGNKVWLGMGVGVLKGSEIGNDVIIGFRSLVTNKIPSNVVAVGIPARVIKKNVKWITNRI